MLVLFCFGTIGLYRDNIGNIGIMEKKMETTTMELERVEGLGFAGFCRMYIS